MWVAAAAEAMGDDDGDAKRQGKIPRPRHAKFSCLTADG